MSKNQTATAQKLIVSALPLANLRTAMLLTLTIVWSGFLSSALAAELKEKAEAEGKVILYASMSGEHCKVFSDAFKQIYPKSDAQFYSAASSPLAERILTESRSGRFSWDVLIITPFYTQLFMKRGLIAPYESAERKFYRDGYKDPKGMWTSIYTNYSVLGYNTKLLPSTKVPRSHFDLLKPEWRKQIGMDDRPYEWFAAFVDAMGQEKGLGFMRSLAQLEPQLRTGRTLVSQLVAAGETPVALTSFSSNFESIKNRGAPVDWVALDPVIGYLHPIALSAKAPNPRAARLFIDFFLSKRGQEIMRSLQRIPDRSDVLPDPPRLVQGIKAIFPSPEMIENLNPYIKLFDQIFRGK
jgi:iron(III) transport system substrate-binding protein